MDKEIALPDWLVRRTSHKHGLRINGLRQSIRCHCCAAGECTEVWLVKKIESYIALLCKTGQPTFEQVLHPSNQSNDNNELLPRTSAKLDARKTAKGDFI